MTPKLYLIPVPLGSPDQLSAWEAIPQNVVKTIHGLDTFIVERAKTARHYIKATQPPYPISDLTIHEIPEIIHPTTTEIKEWLTAALKNHKNIGLMSEAGCPAVADPGAEVVTIAQSLGFQIVPMVGPSSILLALMGSGLNGQSFAFVGYIAAKKDDLPQDLRRLEQTAHKHRQTQLFIETPYRNNQLLATALQTLQPTTRLSIACDLTLPTEYIRTKTIVEWKKEQKLPDLHKRPTIFALL